MRRAPIVLSATVAGVVAVLTFQPRSPATAPSTASTADAVATTTSSATSKATTSATGDAISTMYGIAQVRVTVSGGRITAVRALRLLGDVPKSVQISTSAEPALRRSALGKQSAHVDSVSGATITRAGYEASLQSALDKLGFAGANRSRQG